MGGILILSSILFSLFLWMDLTHPFTLILLISTMILGTVGGIDDYLKLRYQNSKGLSAKYKFLLQFLFASFIASYLLIPSMQRLGATQPYAKEFSNEQKEKMFSLTEYIGKYYIPFFKNSIFTLSGIGKIFAFFIILFVIIGASNATNLTDGLDGLAAGTIFLVSGALSIVAFLSNHIEFSRYLNILYIDGSGEIAIYLSGLCGACLGFLWYNGHPAEIFMGDVGSLSLGGILGVSAILLRREAFLALVGGIFVAEALSVILQISSYRFRNKKRIFLCAPLHHHFEFKGWPETKVVLRFWIVGVILAMIGLISLKFQ
jgi:phospho-N-acetylmuramoyl-pentapeptide-transferase